jgi:hypothetical protein
MHPIRTRSIPAQLPPEYDWEKPLKTPEPVESAAESAPEPEPMRPYLAAEAEPIAVPTFGRGIAWVASIVSLAWLALAAAVLYLIGGAEQFAALTLTEWAGIAAGIAAPLSAIWLIALVAARAFPGQQRETLARIEAAEARFLRTASETRTQIESIDAMLAAVTQRVEGLRTAFSAEIDGLVQATDTAAERTRALAGGLAEDRMAIDETTRRLADTGERARAEFAALTGSLPDAENQAGRIAETLRTSAVEARSQLQMTEDLLAGVWTRSEEASAQAKAAADGLTSVVAAIAASASDAEQRLGSYAAQLESSADTALAKTGEALEATRRGVDAQTQALAAAIDKARAELDDIGGRAVETIAARIEAISEQAGVLSQRLADQDAGSQKLMATVERGFSVLDAKLVNAAQSGENILSSLSGRLSEVRGEIDGLSAPLDGTRGAAQEVGDIVGGMRQAVEAVLGTLGNGIPDRAHEGVAAIDALRGAVANLSVDVERLSERASAVAAPITSSRSAIDELLSGLEDQRESLEASMTRVRGELEAAQGLITGIQHSTEGTALGATSQLIEALGRVREVAAQTSGTVRSVLEGVVEEAREALAKATAEAVRTNVVEPVGEQIQQLEYASARGADAAQAAAERLARQLVSVAETAAAIEARVSEADSHLDKAQRTDLGRQSELLIEALHSSSIDIAKGLSNEITDATWKAYLAGDRGAFSRRSARLLSSGDARDVARRYEEDGEFRDAVRRYIHDFEAMMRRVGADREASALSMTLLSSDVGKLYVALAQATDRLR